MGDDSRKTLMYEYVVFFNGWFKKLTRDLKTTYEDLSQKHIVYLIMMIQINKMIFHYEFPYIWMWPSDFHDGL